MDGAALTGSAHGGNAASPRSLSPLRPQVAHTRTPSHTTCPVLPQTTHPSDTTHPSVHSLLTQIPVTAGLSHRPNAPHSFIPLTPHTPHALCSLHPLIPRSTYSRAPSHAKCPALPQSTHPSQPHSLTHHTTRSPSVRLPLTPNTRPPQTPHSHNIRRH